MGCAAWNAGVPTGAYLNLLAKSGGTGFRASMRVPTDENGLL
jgi:hypothetical protein